MEHKRRAIQECSKVKGKFGESEKKGILGCQGPKIIDYKVLGCKPLLHFQESESPIVSQSPNVPPTQAVQDKPQPSLLSTTVAVLMHMSQEGCCILPFRSLLIHEGLCSPSSTRRKKDLFHRPSGHHSQPPTFRFFCLDHEVQSLSTLQYTDMTQLNRALCHYHTWKFCSHH